MMAYINGVKFKIPISIYRPISSNMISSTKCINFKTFRLTPNKTLELCAWFAVTEELANCITGTPDNLVNSLCHFDSVHQSCYMYHRNSNHRVMSLGQLILNIRVATFTNVVLSRKMCNKASV